jgi:mannose-6-phosphate isomerase
LVLYPLTFHPRFKDRVWGGRTLESLYGKMLPPAVPIGESWEIADRPGDESVVANGPLAGETLRGLMDRYGTAILGHAQPAAANRFPILCKILDARDTLSVQVHPPAGSGAQLGEPKTEMWYIAAAEPDAELYVGLRRGATGEEFAARIQDGTVAECLQRIPVRVGDSMFLPSGRVHAIGAGLVIFEIQQNSDTTFRVFDWNRMGLDGQPRALHIPESMASIDFGDIEPALAGRTATASGPFTVRPLVRDPLFNVDLVRAPARGTLRLTEQLRIVANVEGKVIVEGGGETASLSPGNFCLIPAALTDAALTAEASAAFLVVEPG